MRFGKQEMLPSSKEPCLGSGTVEEASVSQRRLARAAWCLSPVTEGGPGKPLGTDKNRKDLNLTSHGWQCSEHVGRDASKKKLFPLFSGHLSLATTSRNE